MEIMVKSQKWFFLYALLVTLVVFNIGIFMGYKLESSRIDKINTLYLEAEMELLDQRIQKDAMEIIDFNCDLLIQENIDFADRIFEEALKIQDVESANRLSDEIDFQHKRFDLLRTLFWINSMRIKQKCKANYYNVVYFYDYKDPSIEQRAEQKVISNLLMELKEEKGNKIMLIPIAADNELPAVNLLLNKYGIEVAELPVILVDEKIKISELKSREEIEKYLN